MQFEKKKLNMQWAEFEPAAANALPSEYTSGFRSRAPWQLPRSVLPAT